MVFANYVHRKTSKHLPRQMEHISDSEFIFVRLCCVKFSIWPNHCSKTNKIRTLNREMKFLYNIKFYKVNENLIGSDKILFAIKSDFDIINYRNIDLKASLSWIQRINFIADKLLHKDFYNSNNFFLFYSQQLKGSP